MGEPANLRSMPSSGSEFERWLHSQGFARTYVWQDGPKAIYHDHSHASDTAHVILEGEMTLTMYGHRRTYHAGERVDVPADTSHEAVMGLRGCRYLVGERPVKQR